MPIRVGIIGLSANPASWAAKAHIGPLKADKRFEVVALSASTPETAKAAAKVHGVSEEKAYSNHEDLVKDKDVDLVVVAVKVIDHKAPTAAAIKAGKDVFVEWPLASNLADAEELAALAKTKSVKTLIGLQSRQLTVIRKVKQIVDSGALGRVTSTILNISNSFFTKLPAMYEYSTDVNNGASSVHILGTHEIDTLTYVLGEFDALSAFTHQLYDTQIADATTGEFRTVSTTSPDSFSVQGTLKNGASTSVHFNSTGQNNPQELKWIIYGEKGALKVEGPSMAFIFGASLSEFKDGEWKEIKIEENDAVGEIYAGYADERKDGSIVTFDEAIVKHRMVEAIFKSAREGKTVSYDTNF